MLRAVVVPHAPLLVDISGRPHPVPEIPAAMAALDLSGDLIVITSHGSQGGIYRECRGDLASFGLPDAGIEADCHTALATELAAAAGIPLLDAPLDHGAVVPLLLLPPARRVVVWALKEWTGQREAVPGGVLEEADAAGRVLANRTDDVTVVISAHTSAAITSRAPLTERPEGREIDTAVLDALGDGPKRLRDIPPEKWGRAGSCGAGPFRVLSYIADTPLLVMHHSTPFGVGYIVARSET